MIEVFKHFFGFCGEGHPSLICMLGIGPILLVFKAYILTIASMISLSIKNGLKRLNTLTHYNKKLF